ncbi:MAG: hypothetical protein FWE02_07010 [Defluviitaleaceae bacterium]|nr:hypothetical protein [Defluviitaleaceae bacterium]
MKNHIKKFFKQGTDTMPNPNSTKEEVLLNDEIIEDLINRLFDTADRTDFKMRVKMEFYNYLAAGYSEKEAHEKARRYVIDYSGYTTESIFNTYMWNKRNSIYSTEAIKRILAKETVEEFKSRVKLESFNYMAKGLPEREAYRKALESLKTTASKKVLSEGGFEREEY